MGIITRELKNQHSSPYLEQNNAHNIEHSATSSKYFWKAYIKECSENSNKTQVISNLAAREQKRGLFSSNVLAQRCMDINEPLYVCILNYLPLVQNAMTLMKFLRANRLDYKDIQITTHLYFNQTANVRIGNDT